MLPSLRFPPAPGAVLRSSALPLGAFWLALTLVGADGAKAATISFGPVDSGPLLTEIVNYSLPINQFDPSLGTLTGIQLTLGGSFDSTLTVQNLSATDQTFQVGQSVQISLTGPTPSNPFSTSVTPRDFSGSITLAPGQTSGPIELTAGPTTSVTNINPSLFNLFIGTGTVSFLGNSNTTTTFNGGGGNLEFLSTTFADFSVAVTYTFNPVVPEPSLLPGLLLIGGGVAGAVFAQKKTGPKIR
ncbi:choice-of-anchor E domain-containing protein [Gloeobacter kilaueensis]|uniref:PEP-CTERM protein-sorting domain-containing protein n=1 Tax=Gloeobacter kilaueensis (strain ATCC BAA-2537 / CCAP 1431/1 / ULC 316 / JS1) TaxID=1183438 RepID=U5QNM3_GLOK1|nr:choice-of-anchor E domain-containing protein [Gloeobacter kilaueensis]AGY60587.1 hypothetical protein GKIL_4341 [Gloeobacter kilaueensis JS1]